MEALQSYRQRLLERLTSIVGDLKDALAQLPTDALSKPTGPGGWSPHQEITFLPGPGTARRAALSGAAAPWGGGSSGDWPWPKRAFPP